MVSNTVMPSGIVPPWAVMHLAANLKAHSNRSVLRPRRQYDARELRVRRTIAAPARDRCEGAKDHALHRQRRRTEHDHVAELPVSQGELAADTACPYRLCARAVRGRRRFRSYAGTVRRV